MKRPTMSLLPPGGKGMMRRTAFVGYLCAAAVPQHNATAQMTVIAERLFTLYFILFSPCVLRFKVQDVQSLCFVQPLRSVQAVLNRVERT
jgi:hypothetical protein